MGAGSCYEEDWDPTFDIDRRVEGGQSVYDVIKIAGANADQIFIGDTDHSDLGVRSFLGNEDLIKSLAEAGCMHVCLEIPSELNQLIQDYYNGEISKGDFSIELMSKLHLFNDGDVTGYHFAQSIADTIEHAKKYGMQVHAADPGTATKELILFDKFKADVTIVDLYNQQCLTWNRIPIDLSGDEPRYIGNANDRERLLAFKEKFEQNLRRLYKDDTGIDINEDTTPEEFAAFVQYAVEHDYVERLGFDTDHMNNDLLRMRLDDTALYEHIQNITGGEKFALIYGSGHDQIVLKFAGFMGFDENSLVVDICAAPEDVERIQALDLPWETICGQPHFVYVLSDGQVYVTDRGNNRSMLDGIETAPSDGPQEAEVEDPDTPAPGPTYEGVPL